MRRSKVEVAIERHYGTVSVRVGVSEDVEYRTSGELTAKITAVKDYLKSTLDSMEGDDPALIMAAKSQMGPLAMATNGGGNGLVELEMFSFVKGNYKGSDTYKVKCGPYTKYGVAIYPEVMEAFELDWLERDYGEYDLLGRCTVQMDSDGKPKKVIDVDFR